MDSQLRSLVLAVGVIATLTLLPTSRSFAQGGSVTLDHYRSAEMASDGFALSRPDDAGHLRLGVMLSFDYALSPLVYEVRRGTSTGEISAVEHQLVLAAGVSLGLFDRLVLFAGLPVNAVQTGSSMLPAGIQGADGTGLGDVPLGARVRLFGERDEVFALALQATLTLPTALWANSAQTFSGERGSTLTPEVLAEVRVDGWRITGNVGARLRLTDEARLQSLPVSHELVWALGVTIPLLALADDGVGLTGHVEIFGASTFERFADRETSPVEALLGLRLEPTCGLHVGLAGGMGLARGYGAPDFRGVLSIGWADATCGATQPEATPIEEPAPLDSDGDGILDTDDACPSEPEDVDTYQDEDGCPDPDNDADGVLDVDDGAPMDPEDRDGFQDEDGVPDPDNDGDGVPDVSDGAPLDPEDRDGFQDEDGVPDPDNDADGVPDVSDDCPLAPGRASERGCPRAIRYDSETGTIYILQLVEFATNRDVILARSFPVLEEVRSVLAANPQIQRIRIEGHTDDRGRDDRNLDLSVRRARSVRRWLVEHGIAASRLEAWGCGEQHPTQPNTTADGRQANRRVEFQVLLPRAEGAAALREGCVEAGE